MATQTQIFVSGALTIALAAIGSAQGLALAGLVAYALPGAILAPTAIALACCAFVAALVLRWARAHTLDALACMFGATGLLSWGCLLVVATLPNDAAPWVAAACLSVLLMAFFAPTFLVSFNGGGFTGPAALVLATWETQDRLPGIEGPGVVFLAFTIAMLIPFPLFQERIRSIWTTPVWQWVRWTPDDQAWKRFADACAQTVDPTWPLDHQNGFSLGANHANSHLNKPRWEPVLVHTPIGLGWVQAEAMNAAVNKRFAQAFPFAKPPKGPPLPVEVSHSAHSVLARLHQMSQISH